MLSKFKTPAVVFSREGLLRQLLKDLEKVQLRHERTFRTDDHEAQVFARIVKKCSKVLSSMEHNPA